MAYRTATVLRNKELAAGVFSLLVSPEDHPKPGQFYMLRRPGAQALLPRAISICDNGLGGLRFLVQRVGKGTGELAALRPGDKLCLTGPLGNGFPIGELKGKVALVGGGIGAAPMLFTAKSLLERAVEVDVLVGFRDTPILLEELAAASSRLFLATESGAAGHKGLITQLLNPEAYSAVLVCGPTPMMQAAVALCKQAGTPVWVSLENKMACGIGACLVCTCTDQNGKNRRTCKDGPVFRGEEINFDA